MTYLTGACSFPDSPERTLHMQKVAANYIEEHGECPGSRLWLSDLVLEEITHDSQLKLK